MTALWKPYKLVMREVQTGFIGSQMVGNIPEILNKAKGRVTCTLSVNVNMCIGIALAQSK